jgi:hypothetical protein
MLELNPEIVCAIIERAREFHAKEEVVLPDDSSNFSDDLAIQILADHADDLSFEEVKQMIDGLDPDQQTSLVALMWIGRGDFGAEEWDAAYEEARQMWTDHTAEYLLSRPMVADFLEEGLAALGHSCEE